ncbi:MAG: hypothetical protein J2P23_14090, partial [Microlunatus sp.]|nr:hypothetical protein [Microlunatus sp.]
SERRTQMSSSVRPGIRAAVIAAAAVLVCAVSASARTAAAGTPNGDSIAQHLAAAAYISPSDPSWSRIAGTGEALGFVVANVFNGPGSAADPSWKAVIDQAHAHGVKVLGYVDTGYLGGSDPVRTTRLGDTDPTSWMVQAEQDVDHWYSFYGSSIDGIFFDDGMNTCGPNAGSTLYADDYRYLTAVVHAQHLGALSVLNPGISVPPCYEDSADVLATFEGPASSYLDPTPDLAPLPWQAKADPDKFWNIVYDTDASQLAAVMAQSKRDNAGYVYVTPDTLPNPYDTIPDPDYWSQEIALAQPSSQPAPPATVAGLAARSRTSTSVTLGWPASPFSDAVGNDIYRNGVKIASVGADEAGRDGFAYTVAGLTPNTSYSFAVRARNAAGLQAPAVRTVQTTSRPAIGSAPAAPTGVTISGITAGAAFLGWAAGPASVAGYHVLVNGVDTLTLPASVTSVHIGGLALGADATFNVIAVGANGLDSARSATVTASIPNPTPITNASVDFGADTTTFQADYNVPFSFDHVFIDTDSSTATGYQTGGVGAEFMIENGTLYQNTDDTNTFNWTPIPLDPGPLVSSTGGHFVWQVPSSVFGSTNSMTVVFSGAGTSPDFAVPPITVQQDQ